PQRYFKHVYFLASDELKGRGNGTPELERASEYIANQFRVLGLKPAGDNNTYFQNFQITTGTFYNYRNAVAVDGVDLQIDVDFEPLSFSLPSEIEAPIVFAGYGITAPDLQWDDYQGLDVTGKVVLVLRHEPQEMDPNSRFDGRNMTTHATFMNKAINARQHGAKGIVFITDPNNHTADMDTVSPMLRDVGTDDSGIIAMRATRTRIEPLFEKLGRSISGVQRQIDTGMKPESFDLHARARLVADLSRVRTTVHNVMAALPGSDDQLRNEWVVIGAHYDHLGLGDEHSLAPSQIGQIHHGADDNASGTAGVLELARLASLHKQAFKRSILFMTFAGEELGLLGSNYFVNHPLIPLTSITGMINMDMIGRVSNDHVTVLGVGTSAEFKPWIEEFNKSVGMQITYSSSGHEGSDHISFDGKHIPILFFFSGLHSDYHRPSDTSDKINSKGAVQILELVAMSAQRLANSSTRPLYTEVHEEKPANAGIASPSSGGYGPYFGSVPDFRDDIMGVLFADVRADSPAQKAGLKAGDTLVEFGGKSILNLNDFTYALGSKKPGDVVAVVVQRNGQPLKVNVTLEVRK
ncbi:MAG TPA: M28 family peptidase, partial [Terriglobia bacterium]|nr:M28 family peptidase [Terriglobia bacterium]